MFAQQTGAADNRYHSFKLAYHYIVPGSQSIVSCLYVTWEEKERSKVCSVSVSPLLLMTVGDHTGADRQARGRSQGRVGLRGLHPRMEGVGVLLLPAATARPPPTWTERYANARPIPHLSSAGDRPTVLDLSKQHTNTLYSGRFYLSNSWAWSGVEKYRQCGRMRIRVTDNNESKEGLRGMRNARG